MLNQKHNKGEFRQKRIFTENKKTVTKLHPSKKFQKISIEN